MKLETWNLVAMGVGYVTMSAIVWCVLYLLAALAWEANRSYRQACRMERIYFGKGHKREWRKFWKAWRRDFAHDYNSITIGGFRLPHDTRQSIRRDW